MAMDACSQSRPGIGRRDGCKKLKSARLWPGELRFRSQASSPSTARLVGQQRTGWETGGIIGDCSRPSCAWYIGYGQGPINCQELCAAIVEGCCGRPTRGATQPFSWASSRSHSAAKTNVGMVSTMFGRLLCRWKRLPAKKMLTISMPRERISRSSDVDVKCAVDATRNSTAIPTLRGSFDSHITPNPSASASAPATHTLLPSCRWPPSTIAEDLTSRPYSRERAHLYIVDIDIHTPHSNTPSASKDT